jgi:hypothetical protein
MSTVWVEFTKWRAGGPYAEKTSAGPVYRFGWLAVGFSKHSLSAWLAEWRRPLEDLLSRPKARDEIDDQSGSRTDGRSDQR